MPNSPLMGPMPKISMRNPSFAAICLPLKLRYFRVDLSSLSVFLDPHRDMDIHISRELANGESPCASIHASDRTENGGWSAACSSECPLASLGSTGILAASQPTNDADFVAASRLSIISDTVRFHGRIFRRLGHLWWLGRSA